MGLGQQIRKLKLLQNSSGLLFVLGFYAVATFQSYSGGHLS